MSERFADKSAQNECALLPVEVFWARPRHEGGTMSFCGLGTPQGPPNGAEGNVRGQGSLGVSVQTAASMTWPQIKLKKMNGWKNKLFNLSVVDHNFVPSIKLGAHFLPLNSYRHLVFWRLYVRQNIQTIYFLIAFLCVSVNLKMAEMFLKSSFLHQHKQQNLSCSVTVFIQQLLVTCLKLEHSTALHTNCWV